MPDSMCDKFLLCTDHRACRWAVWGAVQIQGITSPGAVQMVCADMAISCALPGTGALAPTVK